MVLIMILATIYLLSFALHIVLLYFENKRYIYRVGDIIDEVEFYMWFPVLNTICLLTFSVVFVAIGISDLLRIGKAWNWFRNIKLK